MASLHQTYIKFEKEKLLEARMTLLEKGVYPFEIFLKEHTETIHASEQIIKLEQIAEIYKNHVPTFYMLTKQSTSVLLEAKNDVEAIKSTMTTYAFLSEALSTCVKEAVLLFKKNNNREKSLYSLYGKDSASILEFCIKKSLAYKLFEGTGDEIVRNLAVELANINIRNLNYLCENVPSIKLYVSGHTHNILAKHLINS
jgi:hypothetical protein